jgi:hypothetical protein
LWTVGLAGCDDTPPGDSDAFCEGEYWLFAVHPNEGKSNIWLVLQSDDQGTVQGRAYDREVSEIRGHCDRLPLEGAAAIDLTRSTENFRQSFRGEYSRDAASGQTTITGTWGVEDAPTNPFHAFTLLDDSEAHIESADDALARRRALIRLIWGRDGIPTDVGPASIEEDVEPPFPGLGDELSSVDLLIALMEEGFDSHIYHFRPADPPIGSWSFTRATTTIYAMPVACSPFRPCWPGLDVMGPYMPSPEPTSIR